MPNSEKSLVGRRKNMDQTNVLTQKFNALICYAESDKLFREQLAQRMSKSRTHNRVTWREACIKAADSVSESASLIADSQIVVLLISPDLLATKCYDQEPLRKAFVRHETHSSRVVLVDLQPTPRNGLPENIQSLPSNGRAVSEWDNRESALDQVAREIDAAAEEFFEQIERPTHEFTMRIPPSQQSPATGDSPPVATKDLPQDKQRPADIEHFETPKKIGRYTIKDVLGKGSFGAVYQALDDELDRLVAIKVPHKHRISKPSDVESYIKEARLVAQLEHPGIVPVFDVERTDDNMCYVVSRFIKGQDLAIRIRRERLSYTEATRIMALVSEAMAYAHQHDIVHRDLKPANILIGNDGAPYVTDFGLAMKDEDFGKGPKRAGTPAYMSPEQARGEGHRVHGRSDVFSLGVIFYELLTGRLPFRSKKVDELLDRIAHTEAKPPRQIDPSIPRELERICLKAMSNLIRDRYTTAKDMSDDLWFYLENGDVFTESGSAYLRSGSVRQSGRSSATARSSSGRGSTTASSHGSAAESATHRSSSAHGSSSGYTGAGSTHRARHSSTTRGHGSGLRSSARSGPHGSTVVSESAHVVDLSAHVVPKGLRAFDHNDAEFFLQLLPGPRDRYGLPESLRFWLSKIDSFSADDTFTVAAMYGPSGCGKTSLVRAGLLPRTSAGVVSVIVEASAGRTEARLEKKIKQLCPDVSPDFELVDLMATIRRGRGIRRDSKLLIVIDQFEQWLHSTAPEDRHVLLDALRQCDGVRVQCLLLVRVDFMMGFHRFMNDLEVPIQEGRNSAAVDLFDTLHARKVLGEFGRAFGRLEADGERLTSQQEEFVEQAVDGIATDGKVIPVHLALFAEMFKGRPWDTKSLRAVGGMRGLGATFLEEMFSATTAPLEHRIHQKAVRAVLKELLPVPGSNLKGQLKSFDELLAASGYSGRDKDFQELLSVLDGQTRLITPTEAADSASVASQPATTRQYQLTHDYLVPSLREWLTKKQKETARGRAQIRLSERSEFWHARPENRHLPSLREYLKIRALTRKTEWSDRERQMMNQADRFHVARAAVAAVALCAMVVAGMVLFDWSLQRTAEASVAKLENAAITQTPDIIDETQRLASRTQPLLESSFKTATDPLTKLNVSLALMSIDADQQEHRKWAIDQLGAAAPEAVPIIAKTLAKKHLMIKEDLLEKLHGSYQRDHESVLRYASALAMADPKLDSLKKQPWQNGFATTVARQLVSSPTITLTHWVEQLKRYQDLLLEPLNEILHDSSLADGERQVAGDVLAKYVSGEQQERLRQLSNLLIDAVTHAQFERFVSEMRTEGDGGIKLLEKHLADAAINRGNATTDEEKERLAKRELRLALALLRLDQPQKIWPRLGHSRDPRVRSKLIEAMADFRVSPQQIWEQLQQEEDTAVRRSLILCLGQYSADQLGNLVDTIRPRLADWYAADPDAGIHGGVDWLLRKWQREKLIDQFDDAITPTPETELTELIGKQNWFVNGQHHTMAVIRGPVTFDMGSPTTEFGREGGKNAQHEHLHRRTIPRTFAIGTKEVTVGQFLDAWKLLKSRDEFKDPEIELAEFDYDQDIAKNLSCPINRVSWYHAAAYCNWLSYQERIPPKQWCYVKDVGDGNYVANVFASGLRLRDDYLTCTGYRLPTETEWEFACRANTATSWSFGESDELLAKYAWYVANSRYRGTISVGTLKPNDFGLFDIYGNVSEWCQDQNWNYPTSATVAVPDVEKSIVVRDDEMMMFRGGGFEYVPPRMRSAARDRTEPHWRYYAMGFRVARTLATTAAVTKVAGN